MKSLLIEDYNIINSRLVRLYMNRFTVDENDATEVIGVHNIKKKTWEEYKECFEQSLVTAREVETPRTDTHLILGNSSINDDGIYEYDRLERRSFPFQLHQLIARHQRSRYHNCCALTILHGSNTFKFFSEDHRRLAYQYQNQDINYMSDNFHYEVNEKKSRRLKCACWGLRRLSKLKSDHQ